ncbi:hypothetical protein BDM02DRAFT_379927 [Thelephora ganbajun]|uniref:Uncharacterized protein n=1 Tax=Thelephora ganbajun TaxID=370292 RepID=A0ACB6Z9G9_THEGA|nr:hypothetical protein BDM02DRAFT_379927 [Thelephora ganbajun]
MASPITSTATATTTTIDQDERLHGLVYPPNFLSSLHVLLPRPPPHQPIRALSAKQFAQIHLQSLLSHAPDSVLFPFLHGLEGDNEAQIQFFSSYGRVSRRSVLPNYRGLIWVACDDDQPEASQSTDSSPVYSDDDDLDDDDFSSSEIECDDLSPHPFEMDIDRPPSSKLEIDTNDLQHMHPVHHRTMSTTSDSQPPVYAVDYAYSNTHHDRRPSNASSFTASSLNSPGSVATFSTSTSFSTDPAMSQSPRDDPGSGTTGASPPVPTSLSPSPPPPMSWTLTSSVRPSELLVNTPHGPEFVRPRVPDGISLRNFGIQVPIYATISDIVIYSAKGATRSAFALAEKFKRAIETKMLERQDRLRQDGDPNPEVNLIAYNVFVLTATLPEMLESLPHLIARYEDIEYKHPAHDAPVTLKANSTNFAHREKGEMRDLTKATEIFSTSPLHDNLVASSPSTHWDPAIGQVYLGNANDVPIADEWVPHSRGSHYAEDPFNSAYNFPTQNGGFDICIECHDFAQFPTPAHMRAADEHLSALDTTWAVQHAKLLDEGKELPVRPPPNANSIVHLTFPSSPPASGATIGALASIVAFLDRWLKMAGEDVPSSGPDQSSPSVSRKRGVTFSSSSLPPQTSFTNSFFSPSAYTNSANRFRSTSASYPSQIDGSSSPYRFSAGSVRTRPVKVLIYSADGYTESSILALCLLMALRGLSLPQAYLELQVVKKRSFFVYQSDLGLLKKVETKLNQDRGRSKMINSTVSDSTSSAGPGTGVESGAEVGWNPGLRPGWTQPVVGQGAGGRLSKGGGAGADSVTGAHGHSASVEELPVQMQQAQAQVDIELGASQDANESGKTINILGYPPGFRRQRASTMPMMSTFTDQSWFNDPRFNGSFPSRVLPFLYLGDLNHASNAYMLHALGITHVVSVGECALVPPPEYKNPSCSPPRERRASLWIEEREGRIKVLDIQGICDDGIDTLEPQLGPICDWIEKARLEGGQVLVHCRVGVSRSATVTIAYVMKHLGISLVDAYLIVRSRRLSVLIQPNMRLLYNLLGWELKLIKERCERETREVQEADDPSQIQVPESKLRQGLSRCLNWPYLAREVHALNEKYLR